MCLANITVHYYISPQQTDLFFKKKKKGLNLGGKKVEGGKTVFIILYKLLVKFRSLYTIHTSSSYSVIKVCFSSVTGNPRLENLYKTKNSKGH